ncbi:RNA polymerase 2 transcription factor related protein [Niveomyces insectorum RCEF 264]|uniref:RNA polymerase 2 transcription factor related protein n=1 Tax=Niveomyces insectorum RCEF 264 TaxID=1081102 RepID=A0A167ZBM0_9HYPO|nr:RNA polymerase 2 transcription factor related protein [Niveomyces insectorum RCEF 264]
MHVVGARALHSAATAPRQCRPRLARRRPVFGAVCGFRSTPVRPARPDEADASTRRDDDSPRPGTATSAGANAGAQDVDVPGSETAAATSASASSPSSSLPSPSSPSTATNTTSSSSSPSASPAPSSNGASPPPTNAPQTTAAASAPENLKDAFAGLVGRGRASRNKNQDGMPPVSLPSWFLKDHVRAHKPSAAFPSVPTTFRADLADASRLMFPKASKETTDTTNSADATTAPDDVVDMAALTPGEREAMQQYCEAWFNGAAWDAPKIARALSCMREGALEAVARRGTIVAAAASYMIAALAYHGPDVTVTSSSEAPEQTGLREGEGKEKGEAEAEAGTGIQAQKEWEDGETTLKLAEVPVVDLSRLDGDGALSMPLRPFGKAAKGDLHEKLTRQSPYLLEREVDDAVERGFFLNTDAGESLVFRELVSTVATEFRAVAPAKQAKDLKRPVSVLTIVNYKGRSKAVAVLDDAAAALSAHVVHLDAGSLADIVGPYLGQTAYWARGTLAMLGYAAAQKNGRLAPRSPAESDDSAADGSVVLSRLPVAFMKQSSSGLSARLSMKPYASEMDDRWDDLKLNNVLEAMIRAADAASPPPTNQPHKLILHVHHFVELSSLPEGVQLLNKLRSIVDRLWLKGRKIVLVGSTSADMNASPSLLEKAEDLRQEDCHLIPFRVADSPATQAMEASDCFHENLGNIRAMVSALTGELFSVADLARVDRSDDAVAAEELKAALSTTVYDVHWVYRFATHLLGLGHPSRAHAIDLQACLQALRSIRDQNQMWKDTADAEAPYFSPLVVSPPAEDGDAPRREIRVGGVLKKVQASDYNEYEKKFLSDLIDAHDIKTTFDDIVCPAETKDSLKALTSLSLIRPEAFLYGVLAAERIPGCLLYGPPGTGKTLLAKAVAKQSGANMLEISAASINDMWVGNSEKNVQALFSLARKLAPVVLFLDEADALLGARQTRPGRGGHRETINQFLREWDGLTDMKAFIMVATNRPFDLDEAVLRRLPRRILVDLPLQDGRLAILRVMLRNEALDAATVSLEALAADTELYSGSDLKNLCVAAAMEAVREEVRAQEAHRGPAPFVFPARRILRGRHFERALQEIGASISEDMSTLQAIRRFDERYGDSKTRRQRRRRGMGFEVVPGRAQSEDARVRRAA